MPYLRNKRTGETIFVPDGPRQAVPAAPLKVQGAQADIASTQAGTARTGVQTQKDIRDLRQTPISPDDQKIIDAMRTGASGIPQSLQSLHAGAETIDRFRTSPERAANVRSAITPPDATFSDTIMPRFMKWWLGVPQKDISDYQDLQRFSNEAVLQKQVEQKGPQTESDALRMMMAGISPDKNVNVNAKIVGDSTLFGLISQKKPDFYARWANRNGSLGALESGKSVDQAWAERVQRTMDRYNADPRIKRLSGKKAVGKRSSAVLDFNDLPE